MFNFIKEGGALLSLLVLLLYSCVREEVLDDIRSENFQPQLVIHGLISPGDSILVDIGKSLPLGDTVATSKITDAEVILSDEWGNTIVLPLVETNFYTATYGISQQNFSIIAGVTYTLSVTQTELPPIEASCTVPSVATPIVKVEHTGNSPRSDDNLLQYDVQVSWYDSGPYLHRLYFTSEYKEVNPQNDSVVREGIYYRSHDPFHGIVKADSSFSYQDSFLKESQYIPVVYEIDSSVVYGTKGIIPTTTTYHLTTYLITPDEHMARYQESLDVFARNRDALSSDSFIELYRGIIPEYSNVEGGLGVFGAYLRSEPVYLTLE